MVEDAHQKDKEQLNKAIELDELVRRLADAEAALKAISESQVDVTIESDGSTPIVLRKAQQALLQSENRYRRLINRMLAMVFELEPDGTILVANEAFLPVTGYTPQEIEGKKWGDIFGGKQLGQVQNLFDCLKREDVSGYDLTLLAKNGSPVTIELTSANYYAEDGTLEKIIGYGIVISQREHEEKSLVSNEELFRQVIESVRDYAIFTIDPDGRITSWNLGAERIFRQPAEEVIGQHFSCFYSPEEAENGKPDRVLEAAAREGHFEEENWRQRKDKTKFWANVVVTALTGEDGKLNGFSKVVRDMTRRKIAEDELYRQSQFIKLLQEVSVAANEASFIDEALQFAVKRICETTLWNIGHVYMLNGEESEVLVSKDIWYTDPGNEFKEFRKQTSAFSFKKGEGLPGTVYKRETPVWIADITQHTNFLRSDLAKKSKLMMGFGFPILVGKKVVGVLEFFSDKVDKPDAQLLEVMENIGTQLGRVVERKQAEEALRNSEARFRAIFEEAALGIEMISLDGRIIASNPAITQMLGYEADELRQVTSQDVHHPANSIATLELFQELREGKRDAYRIEQPYIRKDGRLGWGRSYVSLVRSSDGEPKFAIGMLEDITERKQMEAELAELQRRLMEGRETERLQLARELHDGPIQDLYGISFLLKAFSESLPPQVDPGSTDDLMKMLTNVISTLRTICGELRPPVLAPFGLAKAIRSHAENYQEAYPSSKVQLELETEGPDLPEQVQLVLFRIYQQILNNVARHAQAANIKVHFTVDAEEAILQIKDDGTGFIMPARWIELARKGHLGLVSASDRARAIGGHLKVESKPGQGTIVTVHVPYSVDH
jgi:PAS domain S-box-containing protein